jgi:inhibitor of cysteine peptidase
VARRILVPLGIAAVALGLTACSSAPSGSSGTTLPAHHVAVSQADNAKTVTLASHQTLVLTLPANPTTGFAWTVLTSGTLHQQRSFYTASRPGTIGSGGVQTFEFVPTGTGTQHLSLSYNQPFDTTTPAAETFSLTVVVGS